MPTAHSSMRPTRKTVRVKKKPVPEHSLGELMGLEAKGGKGTVVKLVDSLANHWHDPHSLGSRLPAARTAYEIHKHEFSGPEQIIIENRLSTLDNHFERVSKLHSNIDRIISALEQPKPKEMDRLKKTIPVLEEKWPGNPKVEELKQAYLGARVSLSKSSIEAIRDSIPGPAREHLDSLSKSLDMERREHENIINNSKSLMVAVNRENLKEMGEKNIPLERLENSRKVLELLKSIHNVMEIEEKSHLKQFENLLSVAENFVKK